MKLSKTFHYLVVTITILFCIFSTTPKAHAELRKVNSVAGTDERMEVLKKLSVPYSEENFKYVQYVYDICKGYDFVDDLPELILAIIKVESNFDPNVRSYANCVGLMQNSLYWQSDRLHKLGYSNMWNPYSNIHVGVDLLNDLYFNYANQSIELAVMMYNMDFSSARQIYKSGRVTNYAQSVFSLWNQLKG